jgi:hydroxypyruvate isomerase
VKVLYDIYHAHSHAGNAEQGEYTGDRSNSADQIVSQLEYIGHLHIAGSPKRNFPGEDQEIDYRSLVAKVHQAGYRGFWGQEFIPAVEPFEELESARQLFDSFVA